MVVGDRAARSPGATGGGRRPGRTPVRRRWPDDGGGRHRHRSHRATGRGRSAARSVHRQRHVPESRHRPAGHRRQCDPARRRSTAGGTPCCCRTPTTGSRHWCTTTRRRPLRRPLSASGVSPAAWVGGHADRHPIRDGARRRDGDRELLRPFHSAPLGQHECVVVSVANYQSAFLNVDPTTASEVIDPTIPHPVASGHFGSAWRDTDPWPCLRAGSGTSGSPRHTGPGADRGQGPRRDGQGAGRLRPPMRLPTCARPWSSSGPKLTCRCFWCRAYAPGSSRRPSWRSRSPSLTTSGSSACRRASVASCAPAIASPRLRGMGRIPTDAKAGDVYLVDVAAHYADSPGRPERTVRYLRPLRQGR